MHYDSDDFREFISELNNKLSDFETSIIELEHNVDVEILSSALISIHTIKGISSFFNLAALEELCHETEELLKLVKDDTELVDKACIDLLLAVVDKIQLISASLQNKDDSSTINCKTLIDKINNYISEVGSNKLSPLQLKALESLKSIRNQPIADNVPDSNELRQLFLENYLKIDYETVNHVSNLVSELMLIKDKIIESSDQSDLETLIRNRSLDDLVDEVYAKVNQMSMQPIDSITNKLRRVTRDLAQKLGKEVDLVIEGENTKFDRIILEAIYEPLIHLLRNAIDHGIESPDQRQKAGKNPQGKITVQAKPVGNFIELYIGDDGRGIDLDLIKRRALEKNLYSRAELECMNNQELAQIVLEPSFSTRESVSMISGRGIGMDAVRETIEKFDGKIKIFSNKDIGTTIVIKLPLTKAVISTIKVAIGDQHYHIPSTDLFESCLVSSDSCETTNESVVISYYDQLLALVYSDCFFDYDAKTNVEMIREHLEQNSSINILIIKLGTGAIGLIVDSILGMRNINIKPFKFDNDEYNYFLGSTTTADGSLSLVLNVHSLLPRLNFVPSAKPELIFDQIDAANRLTPCLIFNFDDNKYLLELDSSSTVKAIKKSEIIDSSLGKLIKIDDTLVKLVELSDRGSRDYDFINIVYFDEISLAFDVGYSQKLHYCKFDLANNTNQMLIKGEVNIEGSVYRVIDLEQVRVMSIGDVSELNINSINDYQSEQQASETSSLIKFTIGDFLFALESDDVVAISKDKAKLPLPNTCEFIEGLINFRGEFVVSKNLERVLELQSSNIQQSRNMVIIKSNNKKYAISIDSRFEMVFVDPSKTLANYKANIPSNITRYTKQAYKSGEQIILLLDAEILSAAGELVVI